jgi:hypothetical protein
MSVAMTDSEKLQTLMDREQIRETVFRYPLSVDSRDWKVFRSIFTDEIDVLLTVASRAEHPRQTVSADKFTQSVDRIISSFQVTQHFLTDYRIEVKGDDATCLCYMQARHFPLKDRASEAIWDIGGYYTYHLKRIGDGWKIPKYTLIITWETNRPKDLKIDL